jgi:micrococcal nuclease
VERPAPAATVAPVAAKETQEPDPKTVTVYRTKTGAKYHRAGCRYLSKSSIPMTLEDARKTLTPCSVCNPPK